MNECSCEVCPYGADLDFQDYVFLGNFYGIVKMTEQMNNSLIGLTPKRKSHLLDILSYCSGAGGVVKLEAVGEALKAAAKDKPQLVKDLKLLIELNLVERMGHGGYMLKPLELANVVVANTNYSRRRLQHSKQKEAVAKACFSKGLLGGSSVVITHGTATEPLFPLIAKAEASDIEKCPLRVITNSLVGIVYLLPMREIELTLIGGRVLHNIGGIQPIDSNLNLDSANRHIPANRSPWKSEISNVFGKELFDTAVISTSRIDPDGSVFCDDRMEEFRNMIIEQSEVTNMKILILADSSKFGKIGGTKMHAQLKLDGNNTFLFVDDKEDNENRHYFKEFSEKMGDRFIRVRVMES